MYEQKHVIGERALPFYIIGIVGTYALNILRIFFLMIIGAFYSPEFAVYTFHYNVGWISFVVYLFLCMHLAYKYLVKTK